MKNWCIRLAESSDGEKLWHLKRTLHHETEFLRLSPNEKEEIPADEIIKIEQSILKKSLLLLAQIEEELVGYLSAQGNTTNTSIGQVTIGVLLKYTGLGIGSALINEMEYWAHHSKFTRIQMNVMTHNNAAIRLYESFGYQIINQNSYPLYESDKIVQGYVLEKKLF